MQRNVTKADRQTAGITSCLLSFLITPSIRYLGSKQIYFSCRLLYIRLSHWTAVCNVTLDARQLYSTSRLRYGQIKSVELHENQHCWYRLVPEPGYRIELQIYRLVDTGHLNQSRWPPQTATSPSTVLLKPNNVVKVCGRAVGVDDERKKQQQRKLRFRIAFATATSPPATRLDSVRS